MLGVENQVDDDDNKIKLDLGGNDDENRSAKDHQFKKPAGKDRPNSLNEVSPILNCSKIPVRKWAKRWVLVPNVF